MWDESVERLLQKYADEAQTAVALHRRSYYSYKKMTTCFNLPVIVLSCLSGSLQFLSKGYPDIEQHIVTGTASLSILTAIISAVASYIKPGEKMSRHEQSANQWLLFHNGLKHQLSLRRDKRKEADEVLEDCKTQYDRLFELSPICSSGMIKAIKKKITANATEEFRTPTCLNGFRHTEVYRLEEDEFEDNSV